MTNHDEIPDDALDGDDGGEEPLTMEHLKWEIRERFKVEDLGEDSLDDIFDSIEFHLFGDRKRVLKRPDATFFNVLSPSFSHQCDEVLVSYCLGRRGLDTALRETIYQVCVFDRDRIKLVIFITDKWNEKTWEKHRKAFDNMGPLGMAYVFSSSGFEPIL